MGAERQLRAAPMQSQVNWALLGLVIERPSYAYELAQRFERTYADVLAISSVSHVYTALAALKSRELIEELPGTGSGRQPKNRYRATAVGLEGYGEWLVGQVDGDRRRQGLFATQLALLTGNPEIALDVISRYEQALLLEAQRVPPAPHDPAAPDGSAVLAARLVGEERRLAIGAKLAWVQSARRELLAVAEVRAARATREAAAGVAPGAGR